ncbi:anthrone oxygenase family protein [Streptomyces sp. NPDC059063]|uniref:anthrone oxygenase family protein n=1 Tax=unclassified Streptomyces TaxID=2593676 RepID=UPI0036BDAA69
MSTFFTHGLSVVVLLGSGIVSGVFFAVAVSVIPMAMELPVDRYVEVHKLLGRNYDPMMPIIVITSIVADLVLAGLVDGLWIRALFALSGVLLVGVSVVSRACNVPINRQVALVDAGTIPAGWQDPRPLWRGWHHLRTAMALLGLTLNAIAVAWVAV